MRATAPDTPTRLRLKRSEQGQSTTMKRRSQTTAFHPQEPQKPNSHTTHHELQSQNPKTQFFPLQETQNPNINENSSKPKP